MDQSTRTCSVVGCDGSAHAHGLCNRHYKRFQQTGSVHRKCRTCGKDLSDESRGYYCGDDCKPRCSVNLCGDVAVAKGLCRDHWTQAKRGKRFHATKKRADGRQTNCKSCGIRMPENPYLFEYCTRGCYRRYLRYGSSHDTATCVRCGGIIDLAKHGAGKKHGPGNRKYCDQCRQRPLSYRGIPLDKLWLSQGGICAICGLAIDLSVEWPNNLAPVRDHIVPLGRGGLDNESNIALTHSLCNILKKDKLDSEVDRDYMRARLVEAFSGPTV